MGVRGPEDVQRALDAFGLPINVRHHSESAATAPEAAQAAGSELGAIVKSLCFTVGEQPVLILTAGDRRVDEKRVGALYGLSRKRVRMADRDTTIAVTGYEPGGVPPVGLAQDIPVLIDAALGRYDTVHGAAGAANATFPIPFETLVEITGGKVVEISRE